MIRYFVTNPLFHFPILLSTAARINGSSIFSGRRGPSLIHVTATSKLSAVLMACCTVSLPYQPPSPKTTPAREIGSIPLIGSSTPFLKNMTLSCTVTFTTAVKNVYEEPPKRSYPPKSLPFCSRIIRDCDDSLTLLSISCANSGTWN